MLKHKFEQIINKCSQIYRIPALDEAFSELNGNYLTIETNWSQLDIDRNTKSKFFKRYVYRIDDDKKTLNEVDVSNAIPTQTGIWQTRNSQIGLTAIVSDWKDKNDENQFLEIWAKNSKIQNINLTKQEKHGKLYEKSLVWSSDPNRIAYIAEKKSSTVDCLYTAYRKAGNSNENTIDENNFQEKYANFYKDTWGEQNTTKGQSVIAVFDLNSDEIRILENIPSGICPMQICWYKDEGIVFSGYYTEPYRLGYIYCINRRSDIFYYDLKTDTSSNLTNGIHNVRHPCFSNDFTNLCWLQNPIMGPHFSCSQLMLMEWSTKNIHTLIDIVKEQTSEEFNGIYAQDLLPKCWSLDNKRIIINTKCNHKSRIISCNIETRKVTVLDNDINDLNYLSCINFSDDWICALLQGYNENPTLAIAKLPEDDNDHIKWNFKLNKDNKLADYANASLLKFKPKLINEEYPDLTFEAIFVESKLNKNNTLVVFPHGGPHSAFACEFNQNVAVLYLLGFSIVLVNYRGSVGYGQNFIDSLPGRIGEQDVADVQQVAEYCMETFDFKNAVLFGGSHGGFLTTHLIGQYPDFYSSAVTRNPVTNLYITYSCSDIPDWATTETFGDYNFDYKMQRDDKCNVEFLKRSPINYVDHVKTPILLMLGGVDLRVVPIQGIEYYKALIARKKEAKVLWFKDDYHSLDKPQTSFDSMINTVLWFEKYF